MDSYGADKSPKAEGLRRSTSENSVLLDTDGYGGFSLILRSRTTSCPKKLSAIPLWVIACVQQPLLYGVKPDRREGADVYRI